VAPISNEWPPRDLLRRIEKKHAYIFSSVEGGEKIVERQTRREGGGGADRKKGGGQTQLSIRGREPKVNFKPKRYRTSKGEVKIEHVNGFKKRYRKSEKRGIRLVVLKRPGNERLGRKK